MSADTAAAMAPPPQKRRKFRESKKRRQLKAVKPGSPDETLLFDTREFIERYGLGDSVCTGGEGRPEQFSTLHVDIKELSSTGEGIGVDADGKHVVVVPFCLPGDRVETKIYNNLHEFYSLGDLVAVDEASPDRDDGLVQCRYFGKCSGCQLQMLSYEKQLQHKRRVIEKAYHTYSTLLNSPDAITVGDTHPSPLQYGYRTKLTPHFDRPRKDEDGRNLPMPIGFTVKGRRSIMDIEECPIGTTSLNAAFQRIRQDTLDKLEQYKNGATILMRESQREGGDGACEKYVESDSKQKIKEKFDGYTFEAPAGDFFQNNRAILPGLTSYVRTQLSSGSGPKCRYFVDAYCGSGLFTVTCSSEFERSIGVEISAPSIEYARRNCELNSISNARFVLGSAERLFSDLDFSGADTAVVLDPPRKGCDQVFLDQLMAFAPARIVYVSCNVHTQARDVDFICKAKTPSGSSYRLDSVCGFDLFPQTHHVESVAVLTLER